MAIKINSGDIIKLTPRFWKNLGDKKIKTAVQRDMENGLMQNGKSSIPYKSTQYKKYKSNDMRRFTDGGRLKSMYGLPIESNETDYVNMTLTGHTKRGLKVKSANKKGVEMAFDPADAKKILGNEGRGYDIVGLNEKNIDMARNEILREFDRNERRQRDVTINVNL